MPEEKTILCYGDSNTWGYVPNQSVNNYILQRFSRQVRWPGRLQNLLGKNYHVIEEGLNGRTTNIDYAILPDRNGKTYLPPCLYTHAPIDIVILSLGGNDLKKCFEREPQDIRKGIGELIDIIQASTYGAELKTKPAILLLSVPLILKSAELLKEGNSDPYFSGAREKAMKLVDEFSALSIEKKIHFLDISSVNLSSIDGLHFDKEGHRHLADMLCLKIHDIFKRKK